MQWLLRDAEKGDAERMVQVHLKCIKEIYSNIYSEYQVDCLTKALSLESYVPFITGDDHCVVAEDSKTGDIVAFGCIGKTFTGEFTNIVDFELRKLYVSPDSLRRGIGKLLYGELERRVLEEGGRGIGVTSSLNAVPFYEARGFTLLAGDTFVDVGETAFKCKHLEKQLDYIKE